MVEDMKLRMDMWLGVQSKWEYKIKRRGQAKQAKARTEQINYFNFGITSATTHRGAGQKLGLPCG